MVHRQLLQYLKASVSISSHIFCPTDIVSYRSRIRQLAVSPEQLQAGSIGSNLSDHHGHLSLIEG